MEGYAVAEAPVIVAVAVKLDLAMWRAKFLYTNLEPVQSESITNRNNKM